MANQASPEKTQTWFIEKLANFIKQFPFVAGCIYLGYRDIKKDERNEVVRVEQEAKDKEREMFYREQLIYYRNDKKQELESKKSELDQKYDKDTL